MVTNAMNWRVLRLCLLLALAVSCTEGSSARSLLDANATVKPAASPPPAAQPQQQAYNPGYAISRPSFVCFGDSITEFGYNGPSGWVSLLSQYYSRKADVINRGMAGWNTRWAKQVLQASLQQLMPQQPSNGSSSSSTNSSSSGSELWSPGVQLLTIWFGANDAVSPTGKDGYLSVPVDEYKSNLANMVSTARDAGVPNILLITPPPVNETAWAKVQGRNVSDRSTSQVRKYVAAAKALATELKLPVLDIFALVSALPAEERAAWSDDGLHPSASGQAMVFRALREALDNWNAFAGIRQSSLPLHWPAYNQVDYQDPQKTFDELFEKGRVVPETSQ
eukprot:GHUV01019262.1.p1 GENE.GHUV01019262.1~~GHUV01019262.1.p1  ORF type:complete len:336 (+),score=88.76 GHUV01019262.1:991-1998(+)